MNTPNETLVVIWLGLLLAPPLLFGIWMRYKLYQTEHGEAFLVQREMAKSDARRALFNRDDDIRDAAGKAARSSADAAALGGSHGEAVAGILRLSIPFIIAYLIYGAIGIVTGVVFIF